MLSLLLILTAAFAVLTWKDLHAGLLLLVAVLPSYLLRTEIFGVPTTLLELLVVSLLAIWLIKVGRPQWLNAWRKLPSRHQAPPLFQPRTLPIFLLLLASTVSLFVAPDLMSALGIWKAYFLEPILLFFVVRHELTRTGLMDANRSPDRVMSSRLFQALGVSAIILSIIAIIQWFTGTGLPIPWDIERRVTSVFDYPNALGLFLGPIAIISILSHLSGVRNRAKAPMKIFWVVVFLLSSIAVLLAQSEAAIVSVVATFLIAGLLHRKTRIISTSLIVLSIIMTLLFPPLFQKLTLQDYSGSVRLSQWSETIDMLRDHWLFGAGLSGYPTTFEPYHQAKHLEIFQYPHNIVLNIWVELGLLGLIAFMLLAYRVIVSSRPSEASGGISSLFIRDPSASLGMTQTIVFFVLLQMSIHGLVDVPYFKNDLAILTWILLAILFSKDCPAEPGPAFRPDFDPTARNDTTYVKSSTPATTSR